MEKLTIDEQIQLAKLKTIALVNNRCNSLDVDLTKNIQKLYQKTEFKFNCRKPTFIVNLIAGFCFLYSINNNRLNLAQKIRLLHSLRH